MTRPDSASNAQQPPQRLRFRPAQHLRKPAEFQRVYDAANRAGDDALLVIAAANDFGWTRIGLSVSRKHGHSVRRHHLKRLLREAFRLSQHDLPQGLDLVLIPRVRDDHSVGAFQQSLLRLCRRLSKKLLRQAPGSITGESAPRAAPRPGDERSSRPAGADVDTGTGMGEDRS